MPEQTPDFSSQLTSLLDKLVPPDELVLRLVDGTELKLPGAISARRQVQAFRIVRELLEMPQLATALGGMKGAGTSGMIDAVVALATDEAVAEKLAKAFTAAYPDALGGRDPLDLLPIEELASSILPFSERFVKRLGQGMAVLASTAQAAQVTS